MEICKNKYHGDHVFALDETCKKSNEDLKVHNTWTQEQDDSYKSNMEKMTHE